MTLGIVPEDFARTVAGVVTAAGATALVIAGPSPTPRC